VGEMSIYWGHRHNHTHMFIYTYMWGNFKTIHINIDIEFLDNVWIFKVVFQPKLSILYRYFGLAKGTICFGTGQYWCIVLGYYYIYIYIYIY
jgi:hypothetical protein